ncbi:histidine kinase [Frateuria sp. Soil773]|uniref:sensor histidine kinase n=1 Tax=Frateuria sp. Soil773 TaxID=1736407 RepID=UPI0006FD4DA5|nr:histidine kinase [Frateuria sp. Soil773]KRE89723.1 histidine kinase [Frateuria sp. Soil773]
MASSTLTANPQGLALLLGWRRVAFALGASVALGLPFAFSWPSGPLPLLGLTAILGLAAMLAFGLFEQWPRRLPSWLARWTLQVAAVAAAMPLGMFVLYLCIADAGDAPFWQGLERLNGCVVLSILGLLLAPWMALAALVRQKDALARHQRLAFELERSELERQALDARLHLLQTQVAPHFLFNTLANVQALVDAGSPRASAVLDSLVAYLRAAVPRLHEPASTTFGQELQLVRAYLELMHMRMPDRLDFALHVDEAALALRCPPMTLLTLVENAVGHGIDPSEDGGRIDVHVRRHGDRCAVRVDDTGVGLRAGGGHAGGGLGTGLATLRERLRLGFGADAQLRIGARQPHGVRAELDMPAREAAA